MLKNRSYIIAIFIIIAAGLALFLKPKMEHSLDANFLPNLHSESITSFLIKKEGENEIRIQKDPEINKWVLYSESAISPLIDVKKVIRIIDFLQDTNVLNRVTKKEDAYSKFEVTDEKAIKLELNRSNQDPVIVYLGKTSDKQGQFARKSSDPYVYLLSKQFQPEWNIESWYFKNVLMWPMESLKEIDYTTKNKKSLPLVFDSNSKKITSPLEPPKDKKLKDLNDILNSFKNLSVKTFLKRAEAPKTEAKVAHKLTLQDGTVMALNFQSEVKKNSKDPDRYFLDLKIEGPETPLKKYMASLSTQYVFELNGFSDHQFLKNSDDFYENLPKPKENDTTSSSHPAEVAPKK